MVLELDITNQDVAKIAEMIDAEIAALVPDWKTDTECFQNVNNNNNNTAGFCGDCASNGYIQETVSSGEKSHHNHHEFDSSDDKSCSSVHGRFADIWGLRESHSDDGEKQISRKVRSGWSENEMRRELRWLTARHKIQLMRVRGQTICEMPTDISVLPGNSASPPLLYRAISLPVDAVDM